MQTTDRLNHGVHDNEAKLCQMPHSGEAADQEKKQNLSTTHAEEVYFLISFWSFTERTHSKQLTAHMQRCDNCNCRMRNAECQSVVKV